MFKRISIAACLVATSLLACGAQPPKPPPIEQVRWLPVQAPKCLRVPPPQSPEPPACLLSSASTTNCSQLQTDEYVSALLDHREKLATWARLWWKVCGS